MMCRFLCFFMFFCNFLICQKVNFKVYSNKYFNFSVIIKENNSRKFHKLFNDSTFTGLIEKKIDVKNFTSGYLYFKIKKNSKAINIPIHFENDSSYSYFIDSNKNGFNIYLIESPSKNFILFNSIKHFELIEKKVDSYSLNYDNNKDSISKVNFNNSIVEYLDSIFIFYTKHQIHNHYLMISSLASNYLGKMPLNLQKYYIDKLTNLSINDSILNDFKASISTSISIDSISYVKNINNEVKLFKNLVKNKNILIFGASWCFECQKNSKMYNILYRKYSNDINFIFISIDDDYKKWSKSIKTEINCNYIDYTKRLSKNLNVKKIPYYFEINQDFTILKDSDNINDFFKD